MNSGGREKPWVGAESTAFFSNQISMINENAKSISIPSYAEGPLASLNNLEIKPPIFRRNKAKKNNRMKTIEARFGMKTSAVSSAPRRTQKQLMIDLTPKWQQPAVKEHYAASGRNNRTTNGTKTKSTGVTSNRSQRQIKDDRSKEERGRHQKMKEHIISRTRAVEAKVADKYTDLKPAWRSIAALEEDDGTTKSAIASLLYSGYRLTIPEGGDNKDSISNASNGKQSKQQIKKDNIISTSISSNSRPSWKPQFLSVTKGEKERKAAAVEKLKRSIGINKNSNENTNRDIDISNNHKVAESKTTKNAERGRDRGRRNCRKNSGKNQMNSSNLGSKNNFRQRIYNKKKSESSTPKRRPAWGGNSTKSSSSLSRRKYVVDKNGRRSDSNLSTLSAYSSTYKKSRKSRRSSSQPPTKKKFRFSRSMRSSKSTSSLSSSNRERRPKADTSSTVLQNDFSGIRRRGKKIGMVCNKGNMKSSTFLTSLNHGVLDDTGSKVKRSPMRGKMRARDRVRGRVHGSINCGSKARSRVSDTSLNTSRGLGGFDRELNGIKMSRNLNKRRSVKSAPITTMSSLRLSPYSKSKRVAWMQQPVLLGKKGNRKGENVGITKSNCSRIQKSTNQLSKLTKQSQRQRMQREKESKHRKYYRKQEAEEQSNVSSTFLTGLMIDSPPSKPKKMYSKLSKLSMPSSSSSSNSSDDEAYNNFDEIENIETEIENSKGMSLTFLTSGAEFDSADSPRLSKRVRERRFIPRSQKTKVVKRSLGKSLR